MDISGMGFECAVPTYIHNNSVRLGDDGGLRKRLTFPFRGTELVAAIERTLQDIEAYYQKFAAPRPLAPPGGCMVSPEFFNNAAVRGELLTYLGLFRREPERTFFLSMSDVYYFGLYAGLQEKSEYRQDES